MPWQPAGAPPPFALFLLADFSPLFSSGSYVSALETVFSSLALISYSSSSSCSSKMGYCYFFPVHPHSDLPFFPACRRSVAYAIRIMVFRSSESYFKIAFAYFIFHVTSLRQNLQNNDIFIYSSASFCNNPILLKIFLL